MRCKGERRKAGHHVNVAGWRVPQGCAVPRSRSAAVAGALHHARWILQAQSGDAFRGWGGRGRVTLRRVEAEGGAPRESDRGRGRVAVTAGAAAHPLFCSQPGRATAQSRGTRPGCSCNHRGGLWDAAACMSLPLASKQSGACQARTEPRKNGTRRPVTWSCQRQTHSSGTGRVSPHRSSRDSVQCLRAWSQNGRIALAH